MINRCTAGFGAETTLITANQQFGGKFANWLGNKDLVTLLPEGLLWRSRASDPVFRPRCSLNAALNMLDGQSRALSPLMHHKIMAVYVAIVVSIMQRKAP